MQQSFKAGQRCRVITAYEMAYPDPLILQAGEEITVGQNDTQWPAYIWCTNQAGKGGWVPESYIERRGERGLARRAYAAIELSASVGEELVIGDEEGGWLWCTNQQNRSGWIPADNVEVI